MKITDVEFHVNNENVFSFSLRKVSYSDKYLIRAMIGLDADELIPKYYASGIWSNKKFYNISRKPRELVFRVVLNPNYAVNESVSDIRDDMYRMISLSRSGEIQIIFLNNGAAVSTISGHVVKFEVPYFSETPEAQITLKCEDPFLRGYNPIEIKGENIPSAERVLIGDQLSTAPHGFSGQLTFTAAESALNIQDDSLNPDWSFAIWPEGGFLEDDVLYFSSEDNNKYLYVDRASVIIPLMNSVVAGSIWPILFPGVNELYFLEYASFTWDKISYYLCYWGV